MSGREERRRSPRRDEAKAGARRRVLAAAMEVFACEGYHAVRMDAIAETAGVSKGGVARVEAAVTAALSLFGRRRALARIVLIEAASLGPAYAMKRREVLGPFRRTGAPPSR